MTSNIPDTIDAYIATFPPEVQQLLEQVRNCIRQSAPEATETIKYAMPTFVLKGNLVHFAAFKNHIGFYPAPTGMNEFKADLSVYKTGKGSVQFPIDAPMPLTLITKIVQFRVSENLRKALKKSQNQ